MDSDKNERVKLSYDPWGNIVNLIDPERLFEFWGFKNGLYDRLSDLILFGSRWYSPRIGRWISEDPSDPSDIMSYRDSNNLYRYTLNNPICFLDKTGFQTEKTSTDWESINWLDPEYYTEEYGKWIIYKKYGKVTPESLREFRHWVSGWKSAAGPVTLWGFQVIKGVLAAATGMISEGLFAAGTTGAGAIVSSRGGELALKMAIQGGVQGPVDVTAHVVESEIFGQEVTTTGIAEAAIGKPLSPTGMLNEVFNIILK